MATFRERITQESGEGIEIRRTGKAEHRKHFVGADHVMTEEEAYQFGLDLFDAIASEQARIARQDG